MLVLALLLGGLAVVLGALLWRAAREERRRSEARVAALADAIDGGPSTAAHTLAGRAVLFQAPERDADGAPVTRLLAVGAALLLVVFAALYAGGSRGGTPTTTAAAAQAGQPLELLSLRHAPGQERLTITGLVRNPATAPSALSRVTAIVFFFDAQGTFITSARAPLELATLDPGDEAPFSVSVPNEGVAIGRYRVTFRTDAGLVRHIDRRTPQNLARREAP